MLRLGARTWMSHFYAAGMAGRENSGGGGYYDPTPGGDGL